MLVATEAEKTEHQNGPGLQDGAYHNLFYVLTYDMAISRVAVLFQSCSHTSRATVVPGTVLHFSVKTIETVSCSPLLPHEFWQ